MGLLSSFFRRAPRQMQQSAGALRAQRMGLVDHTPPDVLDRIDALRRADALPINLKQFSSPFSGSEILARVGLDEPAAMALIQKAQSGAKLNAVERQQIQALLLADRSAQSAGADAPMQWQELFRSGGQ